MTEVQFSDGQNNLAGSFMDACTDGPVVLFVHGDGPQDRHSDGGYLPLMNGLLDHGISIFNWDKPSVGVSNGDWPAQSMDDRAIEATAAARAMRSFLQSEERPIGVLGFSQAGWVVPKMPNHTNELAFITPMGPAIDWERQGKYFTRTHLQSEGLGDTEIENKIRQRQKSNVENFSTSATYETMWRTVEVSMSRCL